MPEKTFVIPLSDGCFVVSECFRSGPNVTDFVVRLMVYREDGHVEVVARYDTAHGLAHLDQLKKGGRLIEKTWLPQFDFNAAYEYALGEFKSNHAYYLQRWLDI
jgi:hypothetical protein